MGNRFDASLAGRLATEPTLGTTQDGKPWAKFRLAVDDRSLNEATGQWVTSQTVFHDVVMFGRLAERAVETLKVGDPVIADGEFRFGTYEDASGKTRTATSLVASRIGPDILLADVSVTRSRDREPEAGRAQDVARDTERTAQPSHSHTQTAPVRRPAPVQHDPTPAPSL